MKIALLISSVWGGGAERAMSVLANHWAARGDSVLLITFERSTSDYALDPRVERVSLELNQESGSLLDALTNNGKRLLGLRRVLRAAQPSAVVSFEERMNTLVLIATIGTGLRRIVSERTDPRQHRIAPVWAALRRITYPLADALVVQTAAVRNWGNRVTLDRSRVHVIPNPVRSMHVYARKRSGDASRTVVSVGRLIPAKGFDVLLRAYAKIAPAFPEMKLVIAGEGPERERLEALARALGVAGQLTLAGWLEEPGELLAAADIFVLSSRYEGFPNVLLEAMACGVPVIATVCTGASEIVTHEVDGLLVSLDAPDELARALQRLAEDPVLRERLASRARAVSERYKVETIIQSWDAIIAHRARSPRGGFLRSARK